MQTALWITGNSAANNPPLICSDPSILAVCELMDTDFNCLHFLQDTVSADTREAMPAQKMSLNQAIDASNATGLRSEVSHEPIFLIRVLPSVDWIHDST